MFEKVYIRNYFPYYYKFVKYILGNYNYIHQYFNIVPIPNIIKYNFQQEKYN